MVGSLPNMNRTTQAATRDAHESIGPPPLHPAALGHGTPPLTMRAAVSTAAPSPAPPAPLGKFWGFMMQQFGEQGWTLREAALALREQEPELAAMIRASKLPPLARRRDWARALGYAETVSFEEAWRRWGDAGRVHLQVGASTADGRRLIKVVNKTPAGSPWNYEESEGDSGVGFDYVELPAELQHLARLPDLFAFVVIGESMSPDYEPGDLVFVTPINAGADPESRAGLADGTAVFVRFAPEEPAFGDRCTFKSYRRHPEPARMRLVPVNHSAGREMTPLREHVARLARAVHAVPGWWTHGRHSRARRVELDHSY